jgi:ATP-dependent exoDNAse (exonuclease V) beta subunit
LQVLAGLPARARNALTAFLDLIDHAAARGPPAWTWPLVDHVLAASTLLEFHRNEKGERGQTRAENLEELVSACQAVRARESGGQPSLPQFLDRASLDAGDGQAEEFEDGVQLMTLHSAKGLEFPLVFLAGMEENLFPARMSREEPGRLEEERRLAYVGITRAMRSLFLTYAESRRLHGNETFNSMSRFVREIPRSCCARCARAPRSRARCRSADQYRAPFHGHARRRGAADRPAPGAGRASPEVRRRRDHQFRGPGRTRAHQRELRARRREVAGAVLRQSRASLNIWRSILNVCVWMTSCSGTRR